MEKLRWSESKKKRKDGEMEKFEICEGAKWRRDLR
jgi:hypothetical protein